MPRVHNWQMLVIAYALYTFVHSDSLSAFLACHLTLVDKCPGVQPIGFGEVLRQCCKLLGMMLEMAEGPSNLCKSSGRIYEIAVHAMHQIFLDTETQGVLLGDATNAFEHNQPASHFLQYQSHLVYH